MHSQATETTIGIDTAIVADHRVAVRGATPEDFAVPPTLAGMARLTERLAEHAPALVVAEPTGMTWLAVGHAAQAAGHAQRLWVATWGRDELLCSIPGIGPTVAPIVRAWFGDATQFATGKQAAAFVGLNPSNWESGLMAAPSRPITKEGPPELRLALYQAANVARRRDPQLAVFYRRLMVERGHAHIQANCAVARKLATRVWATLTRATPYEFRDLDGAPITEDTAVTLAAQHAVPGHVRRRTRARVAAIHRGRLSG